MTYHVLEMYDCLDTTSWRRLFERNEVEPQFSRHGEDLSILCVTWNSDEVTASAIYHLVNDILRELKTQSTLYTDVIEPPYRMQPQPLDHGKVVHQWWRGRHQNPLRWPAGDALPEAIRQGVVRLHVEDRCHAWPAVLPQERGVTLQFTVHPDWRTRTFEDSICDALEGLSTPDFPVRVTFVAEKKLPYFPWVKSPAEAGSN